MTENNIILLLHIAYWIGIIADAIVTVGLLFPGIMQSSLGIHNFTYGQEYLYVSRMAASLMLGWTFLLFWADRKPVERKDVLLITIFPVIIGIGITGALAVTSRVYSAENIAPLWIFNIFLIVLYMFCYHKANQLKLH
jgi:hypothetical protein